MTTPTPMSLEQQVASLSAAVECYQAEYHNKHRELEDSNEAYALLFKAHGALQRDLAAAQEWKEAVLDELIVAHIYTKEHDTNPRKAIQDAITWNCRVALDPAVSSDARETKLLQKLRRIVPRLIEVARIPNIEHVADEHNEAVKELRTAIASGEAK